MFKKTDLFQGHVPDRLKVGLLDSRAYNGNLDQYPFAFEKFGVTRIRQNIRDEEYETLELKIFGGTIASCKPAALWVNTKKVC